MLWRHAFTASATGAIDKLKHGVIAGAHDEDPPPFISSVTLLVARRRWRALLLR